MQDTQQTQVRSLGRQDPLEEGTAMHSSILAWRIPWTEEPGQVTKNRTRLKQLSMHACTASVHNDLVELYAIGSWAI